LFFSSLKTCAPDAFHTRWAAAVQRRNDPCSAFAQTLSNRGTHLASTDNSNRQRLMIRYVQLDAPRVLFEADRLRWPIRRFVVPRQAIFLNASARYAASVDHCSFLCEHGRSLG